LNIQTAGVLNQIGESDTMPSENTVYIAIELSFSSWLVAVRLPGAKKSGQTGTLRTYKSGSRAPYRSGR
jgi:hypothetical protein